MTWNQEVRPGITLDPKKMTRSLYCTRRETFSIEVKIFARLLRVFTVISRGFRGEFEIPHVVLPDKLTMAPFWLSISGWVPPPPTELLDACLSIQCLKETLVYLLSQAKRRICKRLVQTRQNVYMEILNSVHVVIIKCVKFNSQHTWTVCNRTLYKMLLCISERSIFKRGIYKPKFNSMGKNYVFSDRKPVFSRPSCIYLLHLPGKAALGLLSYARTLPYRVLYPAVYDFDDTEIWLGNAMNSTTSHFIDL